jgi:hypothetical protein
MVDEPENHTLALLREIRAEIREGFADMKGELANVRGELKSFREDVAAYAYPHQRGIAWGVNAAGTGVNILRGIRTASGLDVAVG